MKLKMNLIKYRKTIPGQYPAIIENDIDLIISKICEIPKLEFLLHHDKEITAAEASDIEGCLNRRLMHEPLQYIFGEAHFRDFVLTVGAGVLIPRPETEMLVDLSLKLMQDNSLVCDLGTGSGAIAISIAKEKPDCNVIAVDYSDDALNYARQNISKYQLTNITLMKSDLFSAVKTKKFHLITANLPYVAKDLYDNLDCEVRSFEPESALLSGDDGLDLIRHAAKEAQGLLQTGGSIIFEFSPEQKDAMIELLEENNYADINIVNDLTGRPRFAIATN